MSFKVIRDAQNTAVAFGPNNDNYEPVVKSGETLTIENDAPILAIDYTSAKNYEIRKVVIGLGKIGQLRTAVNAASDDVIEYWKMKDVLTITDPEVVAIKTALGLSNTALQNLFNSANS